MKIVIDIPDELYEECKRLGDSRDTLFEAIRQSIPYEERPTGKWIYKNFKDYECSCCGYSDDNDVAPYCWYCGARMEKEAENDK